MRFIKAKCIQLVSSESSSIFKGMLTLLVGAGLARVVGLASIPILTRLYSPEDFGLLALYTSFVTILAPMLTLRYVQAIPLPRSDAMAFNVFSLCLKLIFLGSLLAAFVFIFFGESIFGYFNMTILFKWWWMVVLGASGTALYELFSLWATRKKQYKSLARTQVSQSVIGSVVKIGLGLISAQPAGLIFGQFLSQSAGVTIFIRNAKKDFLVNFPKIEIKKEKLVAKFYQDFVWFRLPSQILMMLSVQAPVLMMAALYEKELTGQLSLAIVAVSMPVGLIGAAISKAYYAEIASIGKKDLKKIQSITVDIQKRLFLVGVPVALAAFFLAENIFSTVFGLEWREAGRYASLLAPFILFQFTSSPLMDLNNILSTQAAFLGLQFFRVLGLLLVYITSRYLHIESELFVIIISGYLSLFYLSASIFVLYLLSKEIDRKRVYDI